MKNAVKRILQLFPCKTWQIKKLTHKFELDAAAFQYSRRTQADTRDNMGISSNYLFGRCHHNCDKKDSFW